MPTPDTPDFTGRAVAGDGEGQKGQPVRTRRLRMCVRHTRPQTRGSEPTGLQREVGQSVKVAGGFTRRQMAGHGH